MICSISTKTTGLKPGIHEVIEFSIKPLGGTEVTYRVKPERGEIYESNVQKINGVCLQVAMGFPEKEEVKKKILDTFPNGFQPVGHHLDFDFNMIRGTWGLDFIKGLFKGEILNTALILEKKNFQRQLDGKARLTKTLALKKVCKDLDIKFDTKCQAIEDLYTYLVTDE